MLSDFVFEPVQNEEDPEMRRLHRKLRIQNDRYVSWGLVWSGPDQSAEVDESLSEAGLSKVLGSVMFTIKDIMAEVRTLWRSWRDRVALSRPSPDKKAALVQRDKARVEDLILDLTASIDTLYNLSHTMSSGYSARRMSKTTYKSLGTDESRPFESSRMQTPQHIDPTTLISHPKPRDASAAAPREVVSMNKVVYSELTQDATTESHWVPLLLEYATFDSIYSATGIMPSMSRFEKLSSGLQQAPQRPPGTWTGLPRLLGYFEDLENSRIGLVYRFPPSFHVFTDPLEDIALYVERLKTPLLMTRPLYNPPTLDDLLSSHVEPPLELKFRLAYNLANTIFDMHARGVTHGNLAAKNISFGSVSAEEANKMSRLVDIRRPLVSSFDIFPEDKVTSELSPWRHPLDPHSSKSSPLRGTTDERVPELHSLAMALLSIGLWTRLEDCKTALCPCISDSEEALDRVAKRCGTIYMKAVQACWHAVDDEPSGKLGGEVLLSTVQTQTTRFLEACCMLDDVSGLEQSVYQEVRHTIAAQQRPEFPKDVESPSGYPTDKIPPLPQSDSGFTCSERMQPLGADADVRAASPTASALRSTNNILAEVSGKQKMRLYPHVPLPPDVVDKWNTILMPQINQALRHFCRKHPESVEISLESVGTSPQTTQPTVLVVCTSVGKVGAILKKRIGEFFDDSTEFALKVCRGHVLRSRRLSKSVSRSLAGAKTADGDDEEVEAVNSEYQEHPGNGASIGAWIGDRHLPPVSFGGLVLVDDKPYGMTVHHMLDRPDRDETQTETLRSSAAPGHDWYAEFMGGSGDDGGFGYELSDAGSEPYSETDITSDYGDDDEEEEDFEPGDIPGIEPGSGSGYVVTQPALDDVEEGFYPCPETEDEDHLDTFSLGEVYASSGIRRTQAQGLIHEVDWALFEFSDDRFPGENAMPRCADGKARCDPSGNGAKLRPTTVAPASSLPGMEVQCVARTSGLGSGQILPALTSVKMYGRRSVSHTYQVASTATDGKEKNSKRPSPPMGIPGDSGAWVVDRRHGQVCGHVLAWSQRKRVAYICPMDVLLLDVAQTLEACEVRLPGGEPVVTRRDASQGEDEDEPGDLVEYEGDEAPELAPTPPSARQRNAESSPTSVGTPSNQEPSCSARRLEPSTELRGLASRLEQLRPARTRRIGMSG
ncbi:Protein kinase-like domain protein [Metarhizium album ARSEF 1941]|uniref:Protein kinase-like domain protein n=1 Tax=Metarhizium album (strain ARSEF 1941) TaxID=1081103 RepID=A0A0B2WSU5_METAS|nr:Protein kinase-like domain protein [Metarhizium album ARSEF 1941]KHN97108.1 Protein kinase-like domain protein [Metarhizium album ARSEF 1941]